MSFPIIIWLAEQGRISGPKELRVYGASYIYPMFQRFGLIQSGIEVMDRMMENESMFDEFKEIYWRYMFFQL